MLKDTARGSIRCSPTVRGTVDQGEGMQCCYPPRSFSSVHAVYYGFVPSSLRLFMNGVPRRCSLFLCQSPTYCDFGFTEWLAFVLHFGMSLVCMWVSRTRVDGGSKDYFSFCLIRQQVGFMVASVEGVNLSWDGTSKVLAASDVQPHLPEDEVGTTKRHAPKLSSNHYNNINY